MAGPGDVDAGRAWRTVRRPSDMVCTNLVLCSIQTLLSFPFRMNSRNRSKSIALRKRVKRMERYS